MLRSYVRSPGSEPEYVYRVYSSCFFSTLIRTHKDLEGVYSNHHVRWRKVKCLTDMQTVHRLESHKPQINLPALFHSVFREVQDLCHLWFFDILDVHEIYCRSIDKQFDQLGPCPWIGGVQDNAFDSDGLIELAS